MLIHGQVKLKHEATFSTSLLGSYHHYTQSTVLPNSNEVVIWGRTTRDWEFQFYSCEHGARKRRKIRRLCDHFKNIFLLPFTVSDIPYLTVLCSSCCEIKLVNLETEETTTAYNGSEKGLGPMCLGPPGTVYLMDKKNNAILDLDCKTTTFMMRRAIDFKEKSKPSGMIYLADKGTLAFCSHTEGRTYAMSLDGGMIWEKQGHISTDNERVCPGRMPYLHDLGLLLLADVPNWRILALDGRNGEWVQTIHTDEKIRNIHLIRNNFEIPETVQFHSFIHIHS